MNRKKWDNDVVPIPILALKLAEEVGEVSKEITDAHFDRYGLNNDVRQDRILEELEHVEFLAQVLRDRIKNYNPHREADRA